MFSRNREKTSRGSSNNSSSQVVQTSITGRLAIRMIVNWKAREVIKKGFHCSHPRKPFFLVPKKSKHLGFLMVKNLLLRDTTGWENRERFAASPLRHAHLSSAELQDGLMDRGKGRRGRSSEKRGGSKQFFFVLKRKNNYLSFFFHIMARVRFGHHFFLQKGLGYMATTARTERQLSIFNAGPVWNRLGKKRHRLRKIFFNGKVKEM